MNYKPCSFSKLIKNYRDLDSKVAVVPTDTVIGVISKSPELIYQLKSRSPQKQLVLFINNIDTIKKLTPYELDILKEYWPGQLTIVKSKIAYRMPKSRKILKLISLTGPLYSSSANISGNQPIKKAKFAFEEFKDKLENIIVVKGKEKDNYPSTIVDFDNLSVLRRGRIDGQEVIDKLKIKSEEVQ